MTHPLVIAAIERATGLGLGLTQFNSGMKRHSANGFRIFRSGEPHEHFDGTHLAHCRTIDDVNMWMDGFEVGRTA